MLLLRSPPLHCVPPYVPPHCLYRGTMSEPVVLLVPELPHLPHVALQKPSMNDASHLPNACAQFRR
jgi:hypothetical protein